MIYMAKIYDYAPGTQFIRLYRSKFKDESDFEDLLKFLDLPYHYEYIDIKVEAIKMIVEGNTYFKRSYGGM